MAPEDHAASTAAVSKENDTERIANPQASNPPEIVDQLMDIISRDPNVFGAADILYFTFKTPQARAGMLSALLACVVDGEGRPAVHKYTIVAPPGTKLEQFDEAVWKEFVSAFKDITGRELAERELSWFRPKFGTVVAADWTCRSVLEVIEAQPEQTIVIAADAANYRAENVVAHVTPGATGPLLPEDIWVPHLYALACSATDLAREHKLYVLLDTSMSGPGREALRDQLLSIDRCGVLNDGTGEKLNRKLAARIGDWDKEIRQGNVGKVLRDIEDLPPEFNSQKALLRIQMLHKAGLYPQALEILRGEIDLGRKMDPSSCVKLARIALDANASELARELLTSAIGDLAAQEDLESALATAEEIGSEDLLEMIVHKFSKSFPAALGLQRRHRRALINAGDYAGVAALIAKESGKQEDIDFYNALAGSLSVAGVPDYQSLIASAETNISLAESYRMACVVDALNRKLIVHALDLAMPLPKSPLQSKHGETLLLQVLENVFLAIDNNGNLPVPPDQIGAALQALIERLAINPLNGVVRLGLARLLQPTVAGTMGIALLAFTVTRLSASPIKLEKSFDLGSANISWLTSHKSFLKSAFSWLAAEQIVILGRSVLPPALLTEPPDDAVSAIESYLELSSLDSQSDVDELLKWLSLATSITPHCSDIDFDLKMMRLLADKFASSGYAQPARDLAEQTLLNSAITLRRRRLGWFAMADVYHRCHNYIEGLIALACTLASGDAVDEKQRWHELTSVIRYFRDCGLMDQARLGIKEARQLVQGTTLDRGHLNRLDTLELQIRFRELDYNNPAKIQTILKDVVSNAKAALEYNDAIEPAAILLGQTLQLARAVGLRIPSGAGDLFAQLSERAQGSITSLIAATATNEPSAAQLLALLQTTGSTRYSDDVGFDMRIIAILASRAIASDQYISNVIETSFALELLSDRGVAVPGWDEAAMPPASPQTIGEPAKIARAISERGISIVQAGFDDSGILVRVNAEAGHLGPAVREPKTIMFEERLKRWSSEFPYRYGIDDNAPNLFYTTTMDLRMSTLPSGPVVVVADTNLQSFPPNLLYIDDEFAGRTRAIAAAPSLAWLDAAIRKGEIGDGRLCAWISTATQGGQALSMIAERLESTFDFYGFAVDNGPALPATFRGATLAIIVAHGGVHPERYFQVVSDEGSLRVTADELASALRNIGVVILFVCSGGRADKHPGANTMLGLAKQILDRGCTAVIASPWPLDARVPSHWVPEFLKAWYQGETLVEANFAANHVVDQYFSRDPSRGLAMSLYGNPLLRHKQPHDLAEGNLNSMPHA